MKRYINILILFLVVLPSLLTAQTTHTISGYIKDLKTGEALSGAMIAIEKLETGAYTNNYGFYSLTLPQDSLEILFAYTGYEPKKIKLYLEKDIEYSVALDPSGIILDDVIIEEKVIRKNVEKPVMGVIEVPISQVEMLPFIAGEKDLIKAIQLLPGVQSGGEGSSNFFVRGGQGDQNLILLDEATVYNPFHLSGYLSVFNTDAIRNVTLYKGSFPANYGGRLSSIIDVYMKEGNMQKWQGEGAIGLITSKMTISAPIIKDKMSFMLSGRRSYIDLFIKPFLPKGIDIAYNIFDANAKINYKISDKDRVFISGYASGDVFKNVTEMVFDTSASVTRWSNRCATVRWNHLFNQKLFSNTSLIYSRALFYSAFQEGNSGLQQVSYIQDWNGKMDFEWFPSPKHKVKFGGSYIYHTLAPSSLNKFKIDSTFTPKGTLFSHEAGIYVNDEFTINSRASLDAGLRIPFFLQKETKYYSAEPRLTFKYSLNENTSLKAGYTLMNQYVHQVTSSAISQPFDLWVTSSQNTKPQIAHQGAVGVFRNWLDDQYESSVEVYYKKMFNLIDYKEGANFNFSNNPESQFVYGDGQAYGAEFFIRKRSGKFNGWVSYTLAWSTRNFDAINNGKTYFSKYDRRHNLSIVAIYNFNKYWSFSSVFVYNTGNTMTMPDGRIFLPNNGWTNPSGWVYDYGTKNGYRMPAYHRMDIGLRYRKDKGDRVDEWHIDVYNAYNRRNPFYLYLSQEFDSRANATKVIAKQVSLLPMIPSISYVFSF
ncbi:MAG: TonB-dependent receptor [Bacteroidia bacterium]